MASLCEEKQRRKRERERKYPFFNYPDDELSNSTTRIFSLCAKALFVSFLIVSYPEQRQFTMVCEPLSVTEVLRLSPVKVTRKDWSRGSYQKPVRSSKKGETSTIAKMNTGYIFLPYYKGIGGIGTRFQLINLGLK